MKIRNGFVTNSSSTSYILHSVTSGKLPQLDIGKIDKCVKKMKGYETRYCNGYYIAVRKEIESEYNDANNKGYIEFVFSNIAEPLDTDNFSIFTEGTIYIRSSELWEKHEMFCINSVKEVLNGIKEAIPENCLLSFNFIQTPIDEIGDGWNGGDTEGNPYSFIHDLYKNETKHGYVTMLNGKINFEITNIGKEINILQHASELMMSKSSEI